MSDFTGHSVFSRAPSCPRRPVRALRALLLAATFLPALGAAEARAASLQNPFDGVLQIEATAGEANELEIRLERNLDGEALLTVEDRLTELHSGTESCALVGPGRYECAIKDLYHVQVEAGDESDSVSVDNRVSDVGLTVDAGPGDDGVTIGPRGGACVDAGSGSDRIEVSTPTGSCSIAGGEDDDVLVGSAGQDRLDGGEGDDELDAGDGPDYLNGDEGADKLVGGEGSDIWMDGGSGDDLVLGGPGADFLADGEGDDTNLGGPGNDKLVAPASDRRGVDRLFGMSGRDRLSYLCGGCRLTLDQLPNDGDAAAAQHDDVRVENIVVRSQYVDCCGGPIALGDGRDVIRGDGTANVLRTGRGGDRINGLGGADVIDAGEGPDVIFAADGERDRLIDCGPGIDRVEADRFDPVRGCERISHMVDTTHERPARSFR